MQKSAELSAIDKQIREMWSPESATPERLQATLTFLRFAASEFENREDVTQFLIDTNGLPGAALIEMTKNSVTLLRDEGGHFVAFR